MAVGLGHLSSEFPSRSCSSSSRPPANRHGQPPRRSSLRQRVNPQSQARLPPVRVSSSTGPHCAPGAGDRCWTRSAGPGPCRTRMSGTRSSASSPSEPDRRFTGRPGRPRHRVVTGGAPHNIGIPFRVNAENAGSSRPRGAPPPDRGTRGAVRQHGTCLAVGKHPVAAKCGRATRTARFI